MTDKEKAHQFGEVSFEIKQKEDDLRHLIVDAQRIGQRLASLAAMLSERPFGLDPSLESPFMSYAGSRVLEYEDVLKHDRLTTLESEITTKWRELDNLRRQERTLRP